MSMCYYTRDLNGAIFYLRDGTNASPDGPHHDLYLHHLHRFFFSPRSNVLEEIMKLERILHMEFYGFDPLREDI